MENVGRMFSIHDGMIKREIEEELLGKYNVTFYYENVADFGVPQIRRRGIVIGNSLGLPNPVLEHTHFDPANQDPSGKLKPHETVRSAISDLPKIKMGRGKEKMKYHGHNLTSYQQDRRKEADDFIYGHAARTHSNKDLKIFKLMRPGQWMKDLPSRYNRYRSDIFLDKYKKQSWDKPSSTILAHLSKDGLMFIHPDGWQNRTFTPREAARLQSFDDRYVFEGPRTKQYIQIGNAVPPIFARAIAFAILKTLDNHIAMAIPAK
jgi:DNA (cytosine-5)-methyltransferase 1